MKKRLFLIAAAALALVACAKEEAYEPEVVVSHKGVKVTIGASFEDLTNGTKSDYTAGGDFYWSTGDAIWIGSDEASDKNNWGWGYGSIITGQTNKGPGYATADFGCVLTGGTTTAVAAVFPFESVTPSYTAGSPLGTLSLTLKNTISWANSSGLSDDLKKEIYDRNKGLETTDPKYVSDIKFMQADNVMVARYEDIYAEGYPQGTTTGLQFYNVGGVFCLTLNNIPPGAEKLVFTTDKKITGTFPVSNVEVNSNNYPQIDTEATETEAEKSVTIEFETITSSLNTRVFFIPVPVGSYVIGFDTQDHDGNSLWKFSAARANTVERGHIVKMPALTHVVVSGGGDSATNIITTPTGCNETVYLPSTESNIYVRMNQTGGTITLAYSTIEGAKHPANVYLEALGDIENLNINLPDSHVELKGSGSVAQVITNVTSYTSYATLKVANTVKIGKDGEDNSGLTVTGGSLDLEAPVEGKVKVDIPETVLNTTEEKVSINIASSIKKLDVKRAANQEAANKIYVTIAQAAKVKDSLAVPETNCNLYVANGAEVKVVETKATENTVEGKVETLAASGESTVVTVTKAGSVTESITSATQATVVIENRTNQEVLDGKAGEIVEVTAGETTQGGTITMIDGTVVAYIGSTPYSSLTTAFANAQPGNTVKLLKDYDATSETMYDAHRNLGIDKGIIFEGDGHTLTVKGRGIAVGAGADSNIDVTFRDITIKNSTDAARCIDTRGHIGTLTLDKAKLDTQGASGAYTQPLTIGGNQSEKANVVIKNGSVIQTNDDATAYYAIITFNPVNMTITESTVTGWAAIYMKGEVSSEGSHGSTVNIDKSTINARNVYPGYSNAFAAFALEDGDITINITNSELNVHGDSNEQAIISFNNSNEIPNSSPNSVLNLGEGNTVNVTGEGLMQFDMDSTCALNITGGTFTIDPSAYVADGYQAVKSGNLWTVEPNAYVVKIDNDYYTTLQEAVMAAQSGATIKVIKDFTVTGNAGVTIPADKTITIDLNGKTITNLVTEDKASMLIENKGTLTITDSSTGTSGTMTNAISNGVHTGQWTEYNYSTSIIYNTATLTIEKGTLRQNASSNISYAIDNVGANTSTTVNGGNLVAGYIPIRSYIGQNKSVTIHGGTLTGLYALYLQSTTTLTIDGGTFNAPTRNAMYIEGASTVNISGDAVFNYDANRQFVGFDSNSVESGSTVSVTGGTFSSDPSAYVANGYEAYQDGSVWKIREATGPQYWINYAAAAYESVDETNKVITIANAAQLAKLAKDVRRNESTNYQQVSNFEGYTIRLVADIDLSGKIWFPIGADNTWSPEEQAAENANPCYSSWFRGTFDGNGYTIRNMHAVHEENAGLFGCAVYATFTNIKVEDFEIESNHFAGGVIAWIEVGAKAPSITNCTVKNGTITSSPILIGNAYDNGDKVGGICGFLYTGANRPVTFSGNTVENVKITAYRDFGGLLGYGNYATVSGNTVKDVKLYQNNTNAYKSGTITTFGPEIGRNENNTSTASNNILTNVKMYTGVPGAYTEVISSVAQIGNTGYDSLADAIAAVPTNGTKTTITMIANEEVAAGTNLLIAKTKSIVLDLNGYTISGQGGSKTSEFAFIENKGTLEIIDSGTNGTITYRCTDVDPSYGCGYYTVRNSAKLTLSGGRVVNTTVSGASYAIDNTSNAWGIGDDKDAVFTMKGGVISCPSGDQALRVYQNCSENSTPQSHNRVYINGGVILDTGIFLDNYIYSPTTNTTGEGILTTVEINNGEIHGLIDLKLRHAFNTTFTINGGTFANSQLRIRRVDDSVDHNAWENGISEPTEPIFFIRNGNFTFGASNFVTTGWTSYSNQFSITGGTFNVDPSSHVAAGYAATQTQNGWVVAEVEGEAQIGNQVYETIDAAITAVPTNGTTSTTVKLLKNTEGTALLPVRDGRKVVLDLLGHNLTRRLDLYDGELTVTNGLVSANAYVNGDPVNTDINTYYNTFTLAADATIQASDPDNAYSIILYQADNGTGYGSIVNIYGHIVNSALWVLGNIHAGNSVINVKNGAVIDGGETRVGVAVNGVATLNIEDGATVIGKTAVEVRAGNLNVTGGTIRGTISPGSVKPNGSGTTTEGVGIAISQHTTKLPISAAISGGTIEGHTGLYLINPENNTATEMETVSVNVSGGTFRAINDGVNAVAKDGTNIESATLSITGGSFSSDPTLYVADSHGAVFTTGGKYLVTNANWAYAAASNADFEAATDGTTINISSAALLAKFAKNVNEGVSNYEGYTVNITANIDLSGKVWTPIGLESYGRRFQGTFNGNGNNYTISNMSVKDVENSGLFGTLHGGTIQNVKIDNFIVVSHHYAGPVLAWGESSAIKNIIDHCVVSNGTVITTPHVVDNKWDDGDKAGGLCGWVAVNNVEVTNNSVSNVKITAYRDLGGLLGYAKTAIVTNNTVQNVTVKQSNVHAYLESVSTYGELIGRIEGENTIENNTTSSVTVSHD